MPTFDTARRAALMQDLLRQWLGRPVDLLPFDAVKDALGLSQLVDRGVHEVPLSAIVGTVGREREFNRSFLPRDEALRTRWQELDALAEGQRGFPHVELYRVQDAYFVVDGHHRVSVARAHGAPTIEARVLEFATPVPLAADESLEDVLLKRGMAGFLEASAIPTEDADAFQCSTPEGYERLLEHIAGHRYVLGTRLQRDISWAEAVASWRKNVFETMTAAIRSGGVMEEFPEFTEADMYLMVMDHLYHLRQVHGGDAGVTPDDIRAAASYAASPSDSWSRLSGWWRRLRGDD